MNRIKSTSRISTFAIYLGVCMAVFAVTSWGSGFRNPPDNASALGRDGGKIAQIDDASAVTHNPANLTDLDKPAADISLIIIHTETDFDSPSGASATTDDPWKFLPSFHGAMPIQDGGWVVGLGIDSPFGQSTVWPHDSVFRYSAPYFAELKVLNFNPTLATKLGDRVSVGVGVDLFWSELQLRQLIPFSSVLMAPVPDGRAKLDGDGTGLGANAGITIKLTERNRLAVTYRTPVDIDYEGHTEINGVPPPLTPVVAGRSDFDSKIDFPGLLAVGYGLQLNEQVRLGADVEWVQFSRFDHLPIDLGINGATGLFPSSVPQNWNDTWTFGVGGDWKYDEHLIFRGGYKYLESPIPDETHAPTLPDANRHLITVGFGYTTGANQFDLAYGYTIFENRKVDSNPVPPFNGKYDLSSQLLALSYGRSF